MWLFKRKEYGKKKRDKALRKIQQRFVKASQPNNVNELKFQCSWPIHETDIYDIYFENCCLGLSLQTLEDPNLGEKRLTKEAKEKMNRIVQRNDDDYYSGRTWFKKLDDGMTAEVFSQKKSYYHKPVKFVHCKNIKQKLRYLLCIHTNMLPDCILQIIFQF